MKKIILSFLLIITFINASAQNLLTENFDVSPPTNWQAGLDQNHSDFPSPFTWDQGDNGVFSAQAGSSTSYIEVNYSCAAGNGTISNWLITPSVNLQNGDIISFYTRTYANPTQHPDRLELRIAQGMAPAEPTDSNGVGDYTTLALSVNPNLTSTDYPKVWTKYTYIVTGIPTATSCKVAFRYFVTNGGSQGANADYIGIDTFSIDRNLGTAEFKSNNFSIQPNPVTDVFNLSSKNGETIQNIKIVDLNGRIVSELSNSTNYVQMNISNLTHGIYFVNIQSEYGMETLKIVKK